MPPRTPITMPEGDKKLPPIPNAQLRAPPIYEPTTPTMTVGKNPSGSLPGCNAFAIIPTKRPYRIQPSIENINTSWTYLVEKAIYNFMLSFKEFLELKEGMYHADNSGVQSKAPKPSDWQGSTSRQPGGYGKTSAQGGGGAAMTPTAGGLGGMPPPNGKMGKKMKK